MNLYARAGLGLRVGTLGLWLGPITE